jgi:hypothetical protein
VGAFPDLRNLDLGDATCTARQVTERSVALARDATYTAIGLGLLTFQRVQVRRRQLERSLRG